MMTDEQKARVAEFKAVLTATEGSAEGAPTDVRVGVLKLRDELKREGTTARSLAAELGVHETTLCRWARGAAWSPRRAAPPKIDGRRELGFRVVQVVGESATPVRVAAAAPPARGLRVAHPPSGLVIDGLDVETLAALLRRMA